MKQLLRGLDYCHRRGILHRDIKGSNLLIGSNGILKIADFGLANFYHQHQVEPMTNRVITLWYRPPELLLGATCYGTAIDLWSTGCVLAELYAGEPIMTGRTEVDQLHKIFKLCGSPSEEYWIKSDLPHATSFKPQQPHRRRIAERFKDFPAPALALIETLLSIDPAARLSAARALNSEFFSSKPLACEPAELPKYPSSKELDARVRAEEAQRQAEAGSKGKKYNDDEVGKNMHDAPRVSTGSELSRDNRHTQSIRSYANEDGKNSSRDQLLGKNIHHPGPLIAPPGNIYQMRRDNERRHVQETSRHAHVDKAKQKRVQGEAIPLPTNALYVGPRNRIKQ